ncbi:MAG TPA: hypothetical protein VMK31_00750 [Sphingomicrobium sp.]|nr:hypothetical protein [Sphingomicrobium sp.]
MSVRSFHSVFMVTVVAGAALGCYLVSLRVASERAALDQVQREIVETQYDIRLLQTEIGTRARLAQLERWNVRVLALSAPSADQILGDKFQLARLITPQTKPAIDAPVILATAPANAPANALAKPIVEDPESDSKPAGTGEILHRAGLKVKPSEPKVSAPSKPAQSEPGPAKPKTGKAADKPAKLASVAATPPRRGAKIDPLAPLPAGEAATEGSRKDR